MKEKTQEILDEIDNLDITKRLKKLSILIKENDEYNKLMEEFVKNKSKYISDNTISEEIIDLRKRLYLIPELKGYLTLQNELRILSININKIIISILN